MTSLLLPSGGGAGKGISSRLPLITPGEQIRRRYIILKYRGSAVNNQVNYIPGATMLLLKPEYYNKLVTY